MKKSVVTLMVLGMTVVGAAGVYAGSDLLRADSYKNESVAVGGQGSGSAPVAGQWANVKYDENQLAQIREAFASFPSFETAYVATRMTAGDAYEKAVASGDGVNLVFSRMIVNVSPRDYSDGYEATAVTLPNGVQAKWYTPSDTPMLTFKLDDRIVTIRANGEGLGKAEIEKAAAGIAKLG